MNKFIEGIQKFVSYRGVWYLAGVGDMLIILCIIKYFVG